MAKDELSRRKFIGAAVGASAALIVAAEAEAQVPQAYVHVMDYCDSTWHNPSCPGSASTWKRICVPNSDGKCTCQH
jgi:hypothetical protein